MKIRQGCMNDLPEILTMVKKTLVIMNQEGNDQWSDKYPNEEIFKKDIENNALFVGIIDDKVVASLTIDQISGKGYDKISWTYDDRQFMIIHRLVVDPDFRGGGIARILLDCADSYSKDKKINYLKTDTYSVNNKAQNLFVKNGFNKVGSTFFEGKDKPFYCYEKLFG